MGTIRLQMAAASRMVVLAGLGCALLSAPAFAQATSAGLKKQPAVSGSAAVAADDPIKKKKKLAKAAPKVIEAPPEPLEEGKAVAVPDGKPIPPAKPVADEKVAAAAAQPVESAEPTVVTETAAIASVEEPEGPVIVPKPPAKIKAKEVKPAKAKVAAATDPAKPSDDVAATDDKTAKTNDAETVAKPAKPASNNCRVRRFLVNDYGKEGPTNDAKRLLAADIASWTKSNGYKNVTVGATSVSCEKYIDVGFFDEWTCTASARVCWN